CARVIAWNRTVSNLISKNDEGRIVDRHLVESLEVARWIAEAGCDDWVDFGSGAGFPALPLCLAGVGSRWTLVESRRIKALFLRKAVGEMRLSSVTVVNDRIESLAGKSDFSGFSARAAGKVGETLRVAAELVRHGGC